MITIPVTAQGTILFNEVADLSHSELITQVEWSPDGTKLASMSWSEIRLWDTDNWELLLTIPDTFVYALTWHPNSQTIAGIQGGLNEKLIIWDATTGEVVNEFLRERPENTQGILILHDLSWSSDGNYVVSDSGLSDDIALVWDFTSEQIPHSFTSSATAEKSQHNITELAFSYSGQLIMASSIKQEEPVIIIWDVQTRENIFEEEGFRPIEWGSDDMQVAGVGFEYSINIWNITTDRILFEFTNHTNVISAIAWNHEYGVIVSADIDNNFYIWDTITGSILYSDMAISSPQSLDWNSSDTQLAIATGQQIIIYEFELNE
ncbi:MAG: hypothetical protein Crog4KO_34980 [Crocinitomicaceae bacterium]